MGGDTKSWLLTDNDGYQNILKINDQTYELIEVRRMVPEKELYGVYTDTIYLTEYTQEEIASVITGYGYASVSEINETYGDVANQIIAECMFEQSRAVGPMFKGTYDEARRFIDKLMATDGRAEGVLRPSAERRVVKRADRVNPKNAGWNITRKQMKDALFAKRNGIFEHPGTPMALMVEHDLHLLRETQLAPHIETEMVAGRYDEMQRQKRALQQDIVVEVEGGMVVTVYSSNPHTSVFIADHDIDQGGEDWQLGLLNEAIARSKKNDMHVVF